jgi:hypothetical protein
MENVDILSKIGYDLSIPNLSNTHFKNYSTIRTLGRTLQTVHNVHYEKTILTTTYTSSNRLVLAVMTVT